MLSTDLFVFALAMLMFIPTLAGIGYVWLHGKYQPFAATTYGFFGLMATAAIVWVASNGVFHSLVANTELSTVALIAVALAQILGAFVFFFAFVIRLFSFYWIFIQKKAFNGMARITSWLLLIVIALLFCLLWLLVPILSVQSIGFCYSCVGLLWVDWLVVVGLASQLINIKPSFNERWRLLAVCIIFGGLLVNETVQYFMDVEYRLANILIISFLSNLSIWALIARPIYRRIKNKDEYLNRWSAQLSDTETKNMIHRPGTAATQHTSYTHSHYKK